MKRLGLAVVIVAILIFGAESTLALLRQRTLDIEVQIQDTRPAATPAGCR